MLTKSQAGLSRFEFFHESKMFSNEPTHFYATQYTDLLITYKERVICTLVNATLFNYLKRNI